ncbi:MAG TPA: glycosyltransferase [Gammaproteobacteria bacterium]|nr:glycosyltransferase [Gammaproteobacteria bacterium]
MAHQLEPLVALNLEPRASLVIPSLNPEQALVGLVQELVQRGFGHIVVVDDGSAPRHREIFDAVAGIAGVDIIRHQRNLGKGSALKTGIRHIRENHPNRRTLITVDADGQHLPEDVERIAQALVDCPDGQDVVLGVRAFDRSVPLRSRIGNWATRHLFRLFTGTSVIDTQTGLRGLPVDHADELLNIPLARYEFELEALVRAARTRRIVQLPIRTVYLEGNASSHFRPVVDSFRVYLVFLRMSVVFVRFSAVGALSFFLDLFLFWLLVQSSMTVAGAVVAARAVSGVFNFTANKLGVFGSRGWQQLPRELVGYLGLFTAVMVLSAVGTTLAVELFALPTLAAKIAVDLGLFVAAYFVQRRWIFGRPRRFPRAPVPGG